MAARMGKLPPIVTPGWVRGGLDRKTLKNGSYGPANAFLPKMVKQTLVALRKIGYHFFQKVLS